MKPYRLLSGLTLLLAAALPVHALESSTEEIVIGHDLKIVFMPYERSSTETTELLVIATPDLDERQRQLLDMDSEPARSIGLYSWTESGWRQRLQLDLDPAMDLLDTLRGTAGVELAGYQNPQLLVLEQNSGEFEPRLAADSMYVGINWENSPDIDMFTDLNGDGLDDFLMPDFGGWQVALQSAAGFGKPQLLGPRPRMTFGDTAQFVAYRAQTPYRFDENLDGLDDLAFWVNGRFEVYLQKPDGFSGVPLILDPGQRDVIDNFMSVSLDEEGEEAEQGQRVLDAVGDVDGDGLADMIIQAMQGDGIFGLETSYEVHRGLATQDHRLIFEPLASSIVSSGGIQLNNERLDLSGDGKQEFVVTSVNVTLGTIIGALITRSASVDVSIYQMDGNVFPEQPSLTKDIKVRFDFSRGELFIPAVLSADVTGDGRRDLLVQKDLDTLLVYPGEPTRALFAKSPIRLELELPDDREGFLVSDLDRDGRDELILHLQKDGESRLSVVRFSD